MGSHLFVPSFVASDLAIHSFIWTYYSDLLSYACVYKVYHLYTILIHSFTHFLKPLSIYLREGYVPQTIALIT